MSRISRNRQNFNPAPAVLHMSGVPEAPATEGKTTEAVVFELLPPDSTHWSSLREAIVQAKERGMTPWMFLTADVVNAHRRAAGGMRNLMQWCAPGDLRETKLPDFADLECQKTDRHLALSLKRDFPEVEGFVLDPVIDLGVFSDTQRYCSHRFVCEFTDRHRYDPLPRFSEEDFRFRRDYYSTWEDILFRLQSSLTHELRRVWGRCMPVVYRHVYTTGRAHPNPFRMALNCSSGVLLESEHTPASSSFADGLARTLRRYHPQHQAWQRREEGLMLSVPDADVTPVDVAVVVNWDVIAAMQGELRSHYLQSVESLTACLQQNGMSFHLIPPDVVTTADEPTECGGFRRPEAEYCCLVYPFGWLVRQIDWEVLEFLILHGARVVFYGAAPQRTVEGKEMRACFERLFNATVSPWDCFETARVCLEHDGTRYQSPPDAAGIVYDLQHEAPFLDQEGRALAARRDNAFYLAFDAGTMTPDLIATLCRQ